MVNYSQQPRGDDAVLGGQFFAPKDAAVLGGLDGVTMQLQSLLQAEKWQEADHQTATLMLKIADREKAGSLRVQDIKNFPDESLRKLDKLWVKYSGGHFGFSVQSRIWQDIGGTPNPDWNAWCNFGKQVGWYVRESWLSWNDVTFSLKASIGHLPRGGMMVGWGLGDFWTGCKVLSSLAVKLEDAIQESRCEFVIKTPNEVISELQSATPPGLTRRSIPDESALTIIDPFPIIE